MQKLKRLTAVLALALAMLAGGACGQRYTVDGETFATKEALFEHIRQETHTAVVAPVTPLPVPIAEAVVFVRPTKSDMERAFRAEYPYQRSDMIETAAEGDYLLAGHLFEAIERRNIFRTATYRRASTPAGVDIPANGYLMWEERPNTRDQFIHIMAAGERETTNLEDLIGPLFGDETADRAERMKAFLGAIEEFVRTHPPSG